MRRRLYFVTPDFETARKVFNELLLARVSDRHVHVLAKEGTDLKDLPNASLLQRSDLIHGLESGVVLGSLTGVFLGILFASMPEFSSMANGILLGCWLSGALVGAWISGMIGTSVRNIRLKSFEPALDQGKLLIMADVPKDRVEAISTAIVAHHPLAHFKGIEPTIPAFP